MHTLDGITTACVLFLFACQIWPQVVKNRTQYYAAFGAVLGIILMNTLILMIGSAGFQVFGGVVVGFLQLIAVAMLVLCAGGMTVKTLAGEMKGAYEVIRRGEDEKEIIVPLTGAMPKAREQTPPERIEIVSPPTPAPQTQQGKSPDESIPLQ
jgi:hypothetical protein